MTDPHLPLPAEDRARPSGARVYDYMLGGKDNYEVDRTVAEGMLGAAPWLRSMARSNRDFLRRAVEYLARDAGVRQFLDIGSGIPTMSNVHQIAQVVDPGCRVLYVDNDPMVATYSRALHTGSEDGRIEFLTADATDPVRILESPELANVLDLTRPTALMLVSILMYFDDDVVADVLGTLRAALPPGSFVVISHPTADFATTEQDRQEIRTAIEVARLGGLTYIPRTRSQVQDLFAGTRLAEPGLVPMQDWRPEPMDTISGTIPVHYWVGVGRTD